MQLGAVLATGNSAVVSLEAAAGVLADLPDHVATRVIRTDHPMTYDKVAGALIEGNDQDVRAASRLLADRSGAIVSLQSAKPETLASGESYMLDWLLEEVSTSINTTAAGGNASLMAIA